MKKILLFIIVLLQSFSSYAWEVWYFNTLDWDEVYLSIYENNEPDPVRDVLMTYNNNNCWYYQGSGNTPTKIYFNNGKGWTTQIFQFINGNYYQYDGTNASLIINGIGYGNFDSANKTCNLVGTFGEITGEVIIPDTVEYHNQNYSVTAISDNAFAFCEGITGVSFPESLISIGEGAFDSCFLINSFNIPSSVVSIGKHAFLYCFDLESIDVAEDNKYYSSIDGILFDKKQETLICCPRWFNSYSYLGEPYTVPSTVINIEENAFDNNFFLFEIIISESVKNIGKDAFWRCLNLNSINVVENNPYFSSENGVLFDKNKEAIISYPSGKYEDQYEIPISVIKIKDRAFQFCNTKKVILNENIEEIGERAFFKGQIEEMTFTNSIKLIGIEAFGQCENLSSIKFGSSDLELQDYSFWYCNSLGSVTVPENVKSIGSHVFAYCSSLSEIILQIPVLGDQMFSGCPILKSIKFGEQVRDLGYGAFSNCHALENIEIPETITSLGEWTFFDCIGLKTIKIPDSITEIGERTFQLCSSLESVHLSPYITSIGELAFIDCSQLKEITIPEKVSFIGGYAFQNCTNLETLELMASASIYEWSVFLGCRNLNKVIIGSSVNNTNTLSFPESHHIKEIICYNNRPPVSDHNLFMDNVYKSATLYVPQESLRAYSSTTPWSYFFNIKAAGVDELYDDDVTYFTVFDISGKCILKKVPYNELMNLSKGLYIINGKKMIIGK